MENNKDQENLFNFDSEIMKVSLNKNNKVYIETAKMFLYKFSKVIISSLGKSSEKVVQISEDLVRYNLIK